MSNLPINAVSERIDNLTLLSEHKATFECVARELFEGQINQVLVERVRVLIAGLFNARVSGQFEYESVRLELSANVIALTMANHIEGALISVAKEGKANANIIHFYSEMMAGKDLSPMGIEVLTEMFQTIISENIESIKSGEIASPAKH